MPPRNRFPHVASILLLVSGKLLAANTVVSSSVYTVDTSTAVAHPAIRSIHLTAWVSGSKKYRRALDELLAHSSVNSVTIDIKEYQGEVYIPGVPMARAVGAYVPAIPDLETWLADLKARGIYTIARIVVFKDNIMPRKRPALGVHHRNGQLWYDRNKNTWLNPFSPDAQRYNLLIALRAAELGFDEVQFDYIRFPTDGNLRDIHYSHPYNLKTMSNALESFLAQARQLLHPFGTKISIDVFGLTTSVNTGMGIGQLIGPLAQKVDYVCPMVYPSHYHKGEYGIPDPNKDPYHTVYHALHDAVKTLGPSESKKLRPYLQDFSLGVHYGPREVHAQIQAAADAGIQSWSLWNPRCIYTHSALKTIQSTVPRPKTNPSETAR